VKDSIPEVAPLFWAFRVMVAAGFWMLLLLVLGFYYNAKRKIQDKRWLLRAFLFSIPVPWIAAETGWFVAEFGRQPWAIGEVLPTSIAASSLTAGDVMISLGAFIVFYTALFLIEMYLMFKFGRMGPSSLHTGRYHHEKQRPNGTAMAMAGAGPAPATAPAKQEETDMILDFETLKFVWWVLVGVLFIGFAVTDGMDMGVGTLLPFLGKNDDERRVIINTVGPHWDGNQVWLITAGGAIFAAWPLVYATAFSGFYFAMLLALFALFFRPVGFDYRSKIADQALAQRLGLGAVHRRRRAGAGVRHRLRQSAAGRALPSGRVPAAVLHGQLLRPAESVCAAGGAHQPRHADHARRHLAATAHRRTDRDPRQAVGQGHRARSPSAPSRWPASGSASASTASGS
jgi:hypothetical protein